MLLLLARFKMLHICPVLQVMILILVTPNELISFTTEDTPSRHKTRHRTMMSSITKGNISMLYQRWSNETG